MKHYIIVKLNENTEKGELINPIKELFQKAMKWIKKKRNISRYEKFYSK